MNNEILKLYSGQKEKDFGFGPIKHLPFLDDNITHGLELRPLTVFIGEQGTGKSLFSQILYFFRDLPYLLRYQYAISQTKDPEKLVREVLDTLRSDRRALGVFANPRVTFEWNSLTINLQELNRKVGLNENFREYVTNILDRDLSFPQNRQALFVPAERVLYSHSNQASWDVLRLSSTLYHFATVMNLVTRTYGNWINGIPETQEGKRIKQLGVNILHGEAKLHGDNWKWHVPGKKKQFDIDMASTGQKANWPLILLGEALFEWRDSGSIDVPFSIHIEEPEIHLHPIAQTNMMNLVAFLVNNGFQVLLTTHSPTILYTLNNLMTAASYLGEIDIPDVPNFEFRLSADKVAAYLFEDEHVESLIEYKSIGIDDKNKSAWLDENKLRQIDKDLGKELSRIRYYGSHLA